MVDSNPRNRNLNFSAGPRRVAEWVADWVAGWGGRVGWQEAEPIETAPNLATPPQPPRFTVTFNNRRQPLSIARLPLASVINFNSISIYPVNIISASVLMTAIIIDIDN